MSIEEFQAKCKEVGFEEFPIISFPNEVTIDTFLSFKELSLDLKIYLTEVLLVRSFLATGGIYMPRNVNWMINNFLLEFEFHKVQHWNTETVREAVNLVMSESNSYNKIGTVFLFTVIEFYGKYKLGFEPTSFDFFDERKKQYTEIQIQEVFTRLKKRKLPIARSLNRIDKISKGRYKELEISEERFTKISVINRLTFFRNMMLHGEAYFPDKGKYLVMLYMLFYWNDRKEES